MKPSNWLGWGNLFNYENKCQISLCHMQLLHKCNFVRCLFNGDAMIWYTLCIFWSGTKFLIWWSRHQNAFFFKPFTAPLGLMNWAAVEKLSCCWLHRVFFTLLWKLFSLSTILDHCPDLSICVWTWVVFYFLSVVLTW